MATHELAPRGTRRIYDGLPERSRFYLQHRIYLGFGMPIATLIVTALRLGAPWGYRLGPHGVEVVVFGRLPQRVYWMLGWETAHVVSVHSGVWHDLPAIHMVTTSGRSYEVVYEPTTDARQVDAFINAIRKKLK